MQLSFWAWSSNLVLIRFIVSDQRYCDFYILAFWLEIAYSRPFFGGFGSLFPPNVVTHRSNFQKALPCAETRRLSHKAWKSVEPFDLGAGSREKKGKDISHAFKTAKIIVFDPMCKSPAFPLQDELICWSCVRSVICGQLELRYWRLVGSQLAGSW